MDWNELAWRRMGSAFASLGRNEAAVDDCGGLERHPCGLALGNAAVEPIRDWFTRLDWGDCRRVGGFTVCMGALWEIDDAACGLELIEAVTDGMRRLFTGYSRRGD